MSELGHSIKDYSATAGNNNPVGGDPPSVIDNSIRALAAAVRDIFSPATVASASSCDIGADDATILTISGTTTITSFGTVSAGIWKVLIFSGALTLTYNATSLILPTAASITTAAGDTALMVSLGSGNWRCLAYNRASGDSALGGTSFQDGTVGSPGMKFANDTDSGLYRIGSNSIGLALGGVNMATLAGTMSINPSGSLTLQSGTQTNITVKPADATSNPAGAITIQGGTNSSGVGGNVTIQGGTGSTTSGNVHIVPGTTNGEVELGGGASIGSLQYKAATGHFSFTSTTPSVTAGGGTGVAISGSDHTFKITLGTTPGTTAIEVTYTTAYITNPPVVIAQYHGDHIALRCTSALDKVTITPAASMSNGHVIDVIVFGREN